MSHSSQLEFVKVIADLKACGISQNIQRGKHIHQDAIKSGVDSDVYVVSTLISMYAKCGSMDDARSVFDAAKHPDVVCWNALILGYAENGEGKIGLDMFAQMGRECVVPTERTFVVALKACADLPLENERGKALYLLAKTFGHGSGIYMKNTLVGMYARCGNIKEAHRVFDSIKDPNVISWNALILGYVANGKSSSALDLFSRMRHEGITANSRTFAAVIKACTDPAVQVSSRQQRGIVLHLLACRSGCDSDVYVENILVDMYSTCGSMGDARRAFDNVRHPDVVCWNSLISGYAENGEAEVALDVFWKMVREGFVPDTITFVAALKACAELAARKEHHIKKAEKLHLLLFSFGCDSNIYVQTTLVDMYARCGGMQNALRVFDGVKRLNVVCWNALISGYAENGEGVIALAFFLRMRAEGFVPNAGTFVAALKSCADIPAKENIVRVTRLHLLVLEFGCDLDIYVQSTLVDVYAKCGSLEDAHRVFDSMKHSDVVSWTALITGYAENGKGDIALDLFSRMKREGCAPDSRTFAVALKACSVLGALEMGKTIHAEISACSLESDLVLRNCVLDFYAKCGCLLEGRQVFNSHVMRDLVTWNSLMAGYGRQGDAKSVFTLFDKMQATGLQPDGVTFKHILTGCNHAGLVNMGQDYFELMSKKFGIKPDLVHYNCLIDLLGRANKLEDGMAILRKMLLTPNDVTWTTILGACGKWSNIELGGLALKSVNSLTLG